MIEFSCPQRSPKEQQDIIRRMESSPSTWRKGTMLQNSALLLMFLVKPGSHLFRTECCLCVIPWNDQRTQLTLHILQLFLMRPSLGNPRLEKRHSWNQGWLNAALNGPVFFTTSYFTNEVMESTHISLCEVYMHVSERVYVWECEREIMGIY